VLDVRRASNAPAQQSTKDAQSATTYRGVEVRIIHVEDLDLCRLMFAAQSIGRVPALCIIRCATLADARVEIAQCMPDVAVLDLQLSDGSGATLLDMLDSRCLVIFVTAEPDAVPHGYHVVAKGPKWIREVWDVIKNRKVPK
jgi:CheY-like chemotaxis protein